MSLESTAEELIVVDPSMLGGLLGGGISGNPMSEGHGNHADGGMFSQLEVHDEHPEHQHAEPVEFHDDPSTIEVRLTPKHLNIDNPDPIEVSEEDLKSDKADKAEAQDEDPAKTKKNEKWDWSTRGTTGFLAWVKERCDDVPKHSGYDSAGLERAVAYLERLDNEVSKAMRMDLDGELDANQIEKARATIDNGIERLQDRLDKVKQSKKKGRKKKAEYQVEFVDGLVKEAQKITGVQGVYITVPLLISRIARVCINGMVSAGHDIEDLYERQVKFYKLNDREQAEVMQLLADMGYAVRQDRGFSPDQDLDVSDSDNMDWAANYKG